MKSCKANADDSILLVIDMQEKLLPVIHECREVLANVLLMIQCAHELKIPVIVTEQYPKGLGPTHAAVKELFRSFAAYAKLDFSCFGCPGVLEQLTLFQRKTLVLIGIETHICVNQTALDALVQDYTVHVPADAVSSRTLANKQIGLNKIERAGGIITSTETILYEWLQRAGSPAFKAILPLVK